MRKPTMIVAGLLVVGAALGGCAARPQTSGQLLDRLNSAELITQTNPREKALADIAVDSAKAGQVGLCLRSIRSIKATDLHDHTAEVCADRLDGLGDRPAAEEVVTSIQSPALRDKIRSAYASRPAPNRTSAY